MLVSLFNPGSAKKGQEESPEPEWPILAASDLCKNYNILPCFFLVKISFGQSELDKGASCSLKVEHAGSSNEIEVIESRTFKG